MYDLLIYMFTHLNRICDIRVIGNDLGCPLLSLIRIRE